MKVASLPTINNKLYIFAVQEQTKKVFFSRAKNCCFNQQLNTSLGKKVLGRTQGHKFTHKIPRSLWQNRGIPCCNALVLGLLRKEFK